MFLPVASTIWPELLYATYSTGTPSCAAISFPRSTGTPAKPFSVLVDQNAPPAGLIPIATRSLPVGAIWSRSASAPAGMVVIIEIPRTSPARRGMDRLDVGRLPAALVQASRYAGHCGR